MSQIPRSHFWIYIYLYRKVLLRLKFLINEITLIIDIVNFPSLDCDVPRSTSYGVYFFFLNLLVLLECPVISMTIILGIKF